MTSELPKLGGKNLTEQINISADPELRLMFNLLREKRLNASEIARRAMRRAFQEALNQIKVEEKTA